MNRCRTCGDRYPDAGDGWEGECGNCADITYLAEEAAYHASPSHVTEGGCDECRDLT